MRSVQLWDGLGNGRREWDQMCEGVYCFYPIVLFLSQAGGSSEG